MNGDTVATDTDAIASLMEIRSPTSYCRGLCEIHVEDGDKREMIALISLNRNPETDPVPLFECDTRRTRLISVTDWLTERAIPTEGALWNRKPAHNALKPPTDPAEVRFELILKRP